ncbi:hypothetical protein JOC77_001163 [Peribacillus deserti]|uniref:Uncharacterized protein n=1 Tax=Peribacillus deserti TaxID=673318 RepID=A0ABS2QF33_9BACI|nr:hypothetical protein [Peribacillus deserti]MBM7691756.1 hypothetical protein [Peribacillus deserti]
MDKAKLYKNIQHVNRGNFFAIEIPIATKSEEKSIKELAKELENEGKIKLRECVLRDYSVYLHGIIKYASK